MSTRVLLELATRVMGLWFALSAFVGLMGMMPWYFSSLWNAESPDGTSYFLALVLTPVFQIGMGATLVLWAPGIAAHFYPSGDDDEKLQINVGPGDVYRTACFVLGVYLLILAVPPACRVALAGYGGAFGSSPGDVVTGLVFTIFGVLLAFGSKQIGEWLTYLRYDPNTIPRQRIAIAALLLLFVILAVCLEMIRRISVGSL